MKFGKLVEVLYSNELFLISYIYVELFLYISKLRSLESFENVGFVLYRFLFEHPTKKYFNFLINQ